MRSEVSCSLCVQIFLFTFKTMHSNCGIGCNFSYNSKCKSPGKILRVAEMLSITYWLGYNCTGLPRRWRRYIYKSSSRGWRGRNHVSLQSETQRRWTSQDPEECKDSAWGPWWSQAVICVQLALPQTSPTADSQQRHLSVRSLVVNVNPVHPCLTLYYDLSSFPRASLSIGRCYVKGIVLVVILLFISDVSWLRILDGASQSVTYCRYCSQCIVFDPHLRTTL